MANFKAIPSSTATLTNPAITNPTITGGTITDATVDGFVGTAGAGNLTAYKLCYYDSGTSTLLHAKADAKATARKIMGVTTAAVTAAASATLKRRGYARITADGSCSPVIGADAYLSGATAGCVASAISGSVYPRQVGYFLEGAVAGDGTVLVELALDDARDDVRQWWTKSTSSGGPVASLDHTLSVGESDGIVLEVDVENTGAGTAFWDLRINGSAASGWGDASYTSAGLVFDIGFSGNRVPIGFCAAGKKFAGRYTIGPYINGARLIHGGAADTTNTSAVHMGPVVGRIETGAITSIGIMKNGGASEIADGSIVRAYPDLSRSLLG